MNLIHISICAVRTVYRFLLYCVAPPFCASCHCMLYHDQVFCTSCAESIKPIVSVPITLTSTYTMSVMAVSSYTAPLKRLILSKNKLNPAPSRDLGLLIWQYTNIRHMACDIIVPVPLHWTRYAWRGYNQAEEIAHVLGQKLNRPVKQPVCRVVRTPFQSSVAFDQRDKNVKQVFELSSGDVSMYHGKHLLIVDDLMTSGATLVHVARQLVKLKPASITAVVACRVV